MMKSYQPQQLYQQLEAIALPYTTDRVELGPFTVMSPEEALLHAKDFSNEQIVSAEYSPNLTQALAVKGVSGTMKAPERANLIFNQPKEGPTRPALVYGALWSAVHNRRNAEATMLAAAEVELIDGLEIIGSKTDPLSSVRFEYDDEEHIFTHQRYRNAAGYLWAMGDALVNAAGLNLERPPLHHLEPNLKSPASAVTQFLRQRGKRYQPLAGLGVRDHTTLERMAYDHALLLSGNGSKIGR